MKYHVQYGLKEIVVPSLDEAAKLAGAVLEHWSTWTTCLGTDPDAAEEILAQDTPDQCRVCGRAEELEDITNEALNGRLPELPVKFYLPTDGDDDHDMPLYIWAA